MSERNDGGPAFPVSTEYGEKLQSAQGMTLRDYFAAKAMLGFIQLYAPAKPAAADMLASWAYEHADAMLKAREGGR